MSTSTAEPEIRERRLRQGPPIIVVSGGTGASGELLARTVLAQFPDCQVPIAIETRVLNQDRVLQAVQKASGIPGAIIVHTMVNRDARELLISEAAQAGVVTFDLVGPLLEHLERALDAEPLGQPGLYYQLHKAQIDRVDAIEFTVAHDDGKRAEDLPTAEIVLIGVSRAGKTPMSMYLSMMGWRVSNVPFVPDVPLPEELALVDGRRIVGLTIEPAQLLIHRKVRAVRTGIPEGSYIDREAVVAELRAANHYFYRHDIPVVDTTGKPIETCAEEIAALVERRLAHELAKRS
ncbi:MAG: kinase/pyrophosphorylase [Anaerolineales bacterium]|nr:kinase/pyrophosphorylase [Anaerolineales bacterium]